MNLTQILNDLVFYHKLKKTTHFCVVGSFKSDGHICSNNYNLPNEYFASVFTKHEPVSNPGCSYPDISEISVPLNGVVKLLQNVQPFKACGPDKIPSHFSISIIKDG